MSTMRSKSALQWLALMLVSLFTAERCAAQVPTTNAASSTYSYPPRYELGVMIDTAYSIDGGVGIPSGAIITAVIPGSPARRSGLGPGDIITRVNGWRVTGPPALQAAIANSGGRVTLLGRDGRTGMPIHIQGLSLLGQAGVMTALPTAYRASAPGVPADGASDDRAVPVPSRSVPTAQAPAVPSKSYPTTQAPAAPGKMTPAPQGGVATAPSKQMPRAQGVAPSKTVPTGQGTAPVKSAPTASTTTAPAAPGVAPGAEEPPPAPRVPGGGDTGGRWR